MKIIKIVATIKAKMHQIRFGLCTKIRRILSNPNPNPRPSIDGFKGSTSKGREVN